MASLGVLLKSHASTFQLNLVSCQACRGHGYQLRNDVIPLKRIDAMLQGDLVFKAKELG